MHRGVVDNGTFANRLRKNARRLRRWAKRSGLTAFRLYDRDIPEYPYAVDWYGGQVHLVELSDRPQCEHPAQTRIIERVAGRR